MVRFVDTGEELLTWRKSLKVADRVLLYVLSHRVRYGVRCYSCSALTRGYKRVVLFYSEPDQYTELDDPEEFDKRKRYIQRNQMNCKCKTVVFSPCKEEMARLCSHLHSLHLSKQMHPVHTTADYNLILPAYAMPVVATALIVRPQRIEWESNMKGIWFTGTSILKLLGAHVYWDRRTVHYKITRYFNNGQWQRIAKQHDLVTRRKKTFYKYVQWVDVAPVAFLGGVSQYVSDAQMNFGHAPNKGPDSFLFNSLQNIITLATLPCSHIFKRLSCIKLPVSQLILTAEYSIVSILNHRLWEYPNIQIIKCVQVQRQPKVTETVKPVTCSYLLTCLIHGIVSVNVFIRNEHFYGFSTMAYYHYYRLDCYFKFKYCTKYYLG